MTKINPSNAEPETSAEELETVLARAAEAAPLWAKVTPRSRAVALKAVADALDANAEHLVEVAGTETGLTPERLTGEVKRTTGQLRLYADYVASSVHLDVTIDRADPDAAPPRPELRRYQIPLGPVEVFAAGNFPFAFSVAGTDTASALAAGCPVILKAHPGHPRTSASTAALVQEALAEAGAPLGTFAMITGREAGVTVLRDARITGAAFTGSLRGGRALFDIAAARPTPIPFHGELGSINPVIVTPEALAERRAEIAAGFVASYTLGTGQFCTKPGVLLLPRDAETVELIASEARKASATPMLSPEIAEGYRQRLEAVTATAEAEILVDGSITARSDGHPQASPTLFAVKSVSQVLDAADVLLEECFGPAALIVQYDSVEEAAELLARLDGSLTVTLHTSGQETDGAADEVSRGHRKLVELAQQRAGRVLFNAWPTGVAVTHAQHHGGPYPAATSAYTSVGTGSVQRFLRPVAYQDAPEALLPPALRESNPLGLARTVNGKPEMPETNAPTA